ncbi:hypothetical protein [Campylobacter concisus]|uniref:hypothetical protein n=1 Tax=Campylobacter concisus TaxID=199 RepID=UPI0021CCB19F|nr:hypothetical protein [Campylobacter concisus]
MALKKITNAKINLILAITILFFVGALNVGKMKFSFDERIQTNVVANFTQIYEYKNLHIKKGERLGISSLAQTLSYLARNAIKYNLFENKELKFTEAIRLIK